MATTWRGFEPDLEATRQGDLMATREQRLRKEHVKRLRDRFAASPITEEELYQRIDVMLKETWAPRYVYTQASGMLSNPEAYAGEGPQTQGAFKSATSRKLNAAIEIARVLGWL